MKRDELTDLRATLYLRLEHMRRLGDYGAGAADIRETNEDLLRIIDHLLERMK
jgi:hypothetical protein